MPDPVNTISSPNEDNSAHNIRITHYINPHLFWFKLQSSYLYNEELFNLETSLQNHAQHLLRSRQYAQHGYRPELYEIAMAMHKTTNKWIRVKIESVGENLDGMVYVLWAIDHG